MVVGRGGMLGPRTCIWLFLSLTLIAMVFCHCWNNVDASSLLCEPPYTEPYVRWCGRTAEVTPPPTRSANRESHRTIGPTHATRQIRNSNERSFCRSLCDHCFARERTLRVSRNPVPGHRSGRAI